jgi:hypothetical protein
MDSCLSAQAKIYFDSVLCKLGDNCRRVYDENHQLRKVTFYALQGEEVFYALILHPEFQKLIQAHPVVEETIITLYFPQNVALHEKIDTPVYAFFLCVVICPQLIKFWVDQKAPQRLENLLHVYVSNQDIHDAKLRNQNDTYTIHDIMLLEALTCLEHLKLHSVNGLPSVHMSAENFMQGSYVVYTMIHPLAPRPPQNLEPHANNSSPHGNEYKAQWEANLSFQKDNNNPYQDNLSGWPEDAQGWLRGRDPAYHDILSD